MNGTLKLGLMVTVAYALLYAIAYAIAELVDRFTKDS